MEKSRQGLPSHPQSGAESSASIQPHCLYALSLTFLSRQSGALSRQRSIHNGQGTKTPVPCLLCLVTSDSSADATVSVTAVLVNW